MLCVEKSQEGSSCLFMVTSEKPLSSVCCAEPPMLRRCYRLLPSWKFTVDSYQRVWRISGKEPVEVSLQHPDILSHNRLTLSFLSFSLSPSVPLLLPGFFFQNICIYRNTDNVKSKFCIPFLFLLFVCVWCAHMYMCMHMHVHACVCECMCVHVYTCRVQKLTPDVFLMYPPSYSCRRLSCSNPEHMHTALTSLASQRSRAPLSLSLVWVLVGSSFSLYACMVGVFEG